MEKIQPALLPHPWALDELFAHKNQLRHVFRDVLGLLDIDHVSIMAITESTQFLALSSTPAIEFNLINGGLWRWDRQYHWEWIVQLKQSTWQNLYHPHRYDELYYNKQTRHSFASGLALAGQWKGRYYVFSFASQGEHLNEAGFLQHNREELYQIGQYCLNQCLDIFQNFEVSHAEAIL